MELEELHLTYLDPTYQIGASLPKLMIACQSWNWLNGGSLKVAYLALSFFLIFINDIPLASSLGTWLFADDTSLVESASNLQILQAKMNEQVEKVQAWLLANKLSVHYVKKSQYMLINYNNNIRIEDGDFELKMSNPILSQTKTYRFLGLLVDKKFSWAC